MSAVRVVPDGPTRAVLIANAFIWLPYGLLCLLRPSTLAEVAAMGLESPTAVVEIQAMYGGLEVAIGVLALWGALRPRAAEAAVWSLLVLYCGLAGGRAIGLVASGDQSAYNLGAIALEISGAVLAAWAYARVRRASSA